MANARKVQQCVFMTPLDEAEFAGAVLKANPSTRFINMMEQPNNSKPKYRARIEECKGFHVTMVDSSAVSEDDFHARYVRSHPSGEGWIYAVVGPGLASLLRSRAANFMHNSLLNGEIRASSPEGDKATEEFVAAILREARARGEKLMSIDTATGQRAARADRNFIAWPDAVQKYDGTGGAYLANGVHAVFVPKISGA